MNKKFLFLWGKHSATSRIVTRITTSRELDKIASIFGILLKILLL